MITFTCKISNEKVTVGIERSLKGCISRCRQNLIAILS